MRLLIPLLLVVATAPVADAQLGRLADRARNAVSNTVRQSADAATRTGPAPAFDLAILLDTYFFPERSEFRLSEKADYFLLFPPNGFDNGSSGGRFVLRNAAGREVGHTGLYQRGPTGTPAIVEVNTRGATLTVPGTGTYVLQVEVGRETVAAIPFTAEVIESGDPFEPTPAMRIDGPWRTHGFFAHSVGWGDDVLEFHTWLRRDEPEGRSTTEVSIRRGGREVAWGSGNTGGSYDSWNRAKYRLYTPAGRTDEFGTQKANAPGWTIGDVTPGTYEVVLSTEAGPLRTWTIEGADGAFVPHARSALDLEPRTQYLTPRQMVGQLLQSPLHLDWVGPETM